MDPLEGVMNQEGATVIRLEAVGSNLVASN